MKNENLIRIKTITDFHRSRGLRKPENPLISVADYSQMNFSEINDTGEIFDFYTISIKRNVEGKFRYGQLEYDFDEGILFFTAPHQIFRFEGDIAPKISGWVLLIHPEFFWNTSLVNNIKKFDFFDYSINEALFLSPKEEATIMGIIQNIKNEYSSSIDQFSKQIIISQIEGLLHYSQRFYNRQFITRERCNHQILERLENLLDGYLNSANLINKGLPTVQHIADCLNTSPSYLLGLLKALTGQTTQQHIHDRIIEKAKERLSTTNLSITEIGYELGFEHVQSFSKLFKKKTNLSPMEFKTLFN